MAPLSLGLFRRSFDPGLPSGEFWTQWKNPGDVFSVLLILGGDVILRALAQLSGSGITPVAFSFGWVAYAITAVVSAIGENKLMPLPDCACKVINGKSGYVRDNTSWVIGRIVRDFEAWVDQPVKEHLAGMIQTRWEQNKKVEGADAPKPPQVGLCVSVYKAEPAKIGSPGYDLVYWIGFATTIIQLGIAAIPCGLFGDWGILLVTVIGILLSFASGCLPQWMEEKWACRRNSDKNVILTRGNGSQHAIVILGDGKGLDLEDLAAGQTNVDVSASTLTRVSVTILAAFWILLLITAAGLKKNTWFLLAVGGIGILQNIFVAGWRRLPKAYGMPLTYVDVIGEHKVMDTLFAVEEKYPHIGASMRKTFFPGKLRANEVQKWADLEKAAKAKDDAAKNARNNASQQNGGSQPIQTPSQAGVVSSTPAT
ncbi:hypothetical protein LTR11_004390 [Exophiala xenobiotica]|nr:hypothetical protein LTR11_004390 [Exophiala xenobiotica]